MDNTQIDLRLRAVRLLAMDVDGVLTDGTITYASSSTGEALELKGFNVKDGLALSLVRTAGLEVAWITGRVSPIVERRAAELGVRELIQWARNKRVALGEVAGRLGLQPEQVLYLGDDLNDLPAFAAAGVRVAVADAVAEVRDQADWITTTPGGGGAVREVVERLLKAQGQWEAAVSGFLARLETEHGKPPSQ